MNYAGQRVFTCFSVDGLKPKRDKIVHVDDAGALRRLEQDRERADAVLKSWVLAASGSATVDMEMTVVEVPAELLKELPRIKDQYGSAMDMSVSVGVGINLGDASKALKVAQRRGGDRIVLWTDELSKELEEKEKGDKDPLENLGKADALNEGTGAGMSGASRPLQASVTKPETEASAHSETDSVASPEPIEQTHAAAGLEERMHDLAQVHEDQDQQLGTDQDHQHLTGIKAQVVQVLKQVQAQAPILEKLAQASPELYQSIVAMAQSVVALARELPKETDELELTSVAELDQKAQGLSKSGIMLKELIKAEVLNRLGHGSGGFNIDSEHSLPGPLAAEGYRLGIAHSPQETVATVTRGQKTVGRMYWNPQMSGAIWAGGSCPRHGLEDAVKVVVSGHTQGRHEPDRWNEAGGISQKPIAKADPLLLTSTSARGSEITKPSRTYEEGVQRQDGKNVWVRQSSDPDNSRRTLMVQFASPLLQGNRQPDEADAYYDKLYANREGYHRAQDFWEIPQWQAHLANSMPEADSYVVRDPEEAVDFANRAGYKNLAFSALDVNKDFIRDLAQKYNGQIHVGGYTDMSHFKDLPNVIVHPNMKSFVESQGQEYRPGYDYRHFEGTKTIPRLTLSDGCRHQCSFCAVPKNLEEKPESEIMQQVDAFAKHLPAELIYLNDKTYGQSPNHKLLPQIHQRIKAQNPNFKGFIVQTTAAQMRKLSPEFLRDAGIKHVELGVESFNDPILRAHKKPATEALINESAQKLRQAGVSLIPNIMVGLPGENEQTYNKTMNWLHSNKDIISHANIYNLALYDNSELGKKIGALSAADRDENQIDKSFHVDPQVHHNFHKAVTDFASKQLDPKPVQKSELQALKAKIRELVLAKAGALGGVKRDPKDFDPEQLKAGIEVELEHTQDREIAEEIALDHLHEDKDYYKKLKVMESDQGPVISELEKDALNPGTGHLAVAGAKTTRENLVTPIGTAKDSSPDGTRDAGKVKTQGADGKVRWRQVRSGQILGPDGSTVSAINPTGK